VRVYRQRGALEKEWVGDYKPKIEEVTGITKSLGQTFYKVTGAGKEFIRSEIILVDKKNPEEPARPAVAEPEAPRVSYRMKRLIDRDNRKAAKAEKDKAAAERKEAIEVAKAEAKAKVKAAREKVKQEEKAKKEADKWWNAMAKKMRERDERRRKVK
jgi:hypothetical protein